MDTKHLLDGADRFSRLAGETQRDRPGVRVVVTPDHDVIRRWAAQHHAEPATGEATVSGPATIDVRDGGAGIRFNFPGFARLFRPISWEEWFDNFDRHNLLFVFEEEDTQQVAERAYKTWEARGHEVGDGRADWFQAERDLQREAGGESPSVRYRFVKNKSDA